MKNIFKNSIMIALVAALAVASLPLVSAAAMGQDDPVPPQGLVSKERLERIWARELRIYNQIGSGFDRADQVTLRVQNLIDHAAQNGKDVFAVQAALDAFESALKDAHPIYESGKGIVSSHQGFDSNGQVTNTEKANETVMQMGEKLREIRDAMNGTGKALRAAIRAFREANPRPQNMPTPSGS